jgi:hypothetical protein
VTECGIGSRAKVFIVFNETGLRNIKILCHKYIPVMISLYALSKFVTQELF